MQKGKTLSTMGRFAPYMSRYKGVVALDLFCAALTTLCELTLPMIMRTLTNAATQDAVAFSMTLVAKMGLIYFVLRMIDCVAAYVMANMGHVMGAKIETDMRRDAFEHLQKLSDSYFANTKVGQIMGRITNDLFDVTEFAHHCPEEFFIALLKGTVSFIILANINLWLTIIIFCFIPIMYFCCMRFNKRVKEAFRKQRRHIGELNARLEDSLLGERVVKAFGGEEQECEKFEKDNSRFLDIKKESYKYMSLFQTTTRFFDGVMYIVVIVAGGWFLSKRLISSGDLVAYLLYVSTLLVT
ncbi:MAG: ABC transporter ATP-binding protein, partial [Oscillospiraceae bacterium]